MGPAVATRSLENLLDRHDPAPRLLLRVTLDPSVGAWPQRVRAVTGVRSFSKLVKDTFRRAGFELHRYIPRLSPDAQLALILTHLDVDLVLDVGANEGQYVETLRALGYRRRVVSFEPLASAHAKLSATAASDPGWEVAPRAALGDAEGEVPLNVSGHSLSSSILDMLPLHEQASLGSSVVGKELVPLARLDQMGFPYLKDARSVLLKIDTQGYEERVLAGAAGILDRIRAIQCELSLAPLYRGQPLFDEMRERVDRLGFELYAVFPGYVHDRTGQTLQVDGLFVRRGSGAGRS